MRRPKKVPCRQTAQQRSFTHSNFDRTCYHHWKSSKFRTPLEKAPNFDEIWSCCFPNQPGSLCFDQRKLNRSEGVFTLKEAAKEAKRRRRREEAEVQRFALHFVCFLVLPGCQLPPLFSPAAPHRAHQPRPHPIFWYFNDLILISILK